jgi:hypothetical protein
MRLAVALEQAFEGGGGVPPSAAHPGPTLSELLLHLDHHGLVALLVDEPRWWWRGRRWCHLVSDHDLEELHAFAAALGVPRRAFQGDHYDLHEELRLEALVAGAEAVPSRELVRRLRAAGLRLSPAARRAQQG